MGYVYFLNLRYQAQQFGFALAVHYIAEITSGQFAVLYFQFIGIDIVDTVFLLEITPEISETARKDGNLITVFLQNIHQAVNTFRNRQVLGNLLHDRLVQAFQQSHPLAEAFRKVYLSTHGTFRNSLYLLADTCTYGQFVYNLGLYQCRVHVKANKAAHTTIHIVQLERKVHFQFAGQLHQLLLHGYTVFRCASYGELNAGACFRIAFIQRNTPRKALDGIDIHTLLRQNTGNRRNLAGRQLTSEQRENITVLTLHAHPVFILLRRNRIEADSDTQRRCLEKQLFHDKAGMLFFRFT